MNKKTLTQDEKCLKNLLVESNQEVAWGKHFVRSGIKCYLTPKMRVEVELKGNLIRLSTDEALALSEILLNAVDEEKKVLSAYLDAAPSKAPSSEELVANDFFESAINLVNEVQKTATLRQRLFFNARLLTHVNESQQRIRSGLYELHGN
jgi:hypothetical protein